MNVILVTGGAGFIGANFVRHMLEHDPAVRVVTLDALTYAGNRGNLAFPDESGRHRFVHGDIRDAALVRGILHDEAVDTIVHFAAETHVDRSIHAPEVFFGTNVAGTVTMLEAAHAYWSGPDAPAGPVRFHHVSTDEVYGTLGPGEPPWDERTPYAPRSPYAASKAAADHAVRAFGHTYGLPCTITNCSNNYGPFQHPEKLVPLTILNALEGREIPLYGDGMQVRDWLYVDDHCGAVRHVLERGLPGETYHVGGGTQVTNRALVGTICRLVDGIDPLPDGRTRESLITFVADRPGHDRRYALDCAKIAAGTGWRVGHTLEDGLAATVRWYLDNRGWLDAVAARPGFGDWLQANYEGRD